MNHIENTFRRPFCGGYLVFYCYSGLFVSLSNTLSGIAFQPDMWGNKINSPKTMAEEQGCPIQRARMTPSREVRVCWGENLRLFAVTVDTLRRFPNALLISLMLAEPLAMLVHHHGQIHVYPDLEMPNVTCLPLDTISQRKWAIKYLKPNIVTKTLKNILHIWKMDCLGWWLEARDSRESEGKCIWEERGPEAYWKLRCLWGKKNQYGPWIF